MACELKGAAGMIFRPAATAAAVLLVAGLLDAPLTRAQERLEFEVASIKERPFVPGSQMGVEFQPGARLIATMAPVQLLIMSAYRLREAQLQFSPNVPVTALNTFYDIQAKSGANTIPSGREGARKMELMLQTLLADRFRLKMHTEKRDLSIYALLVDKNGLKLQRAPNRDCSVTPSPCRWLSVGPGSGIIGQSVTLQGLADQLDGFEGRGILNKTGIEGLFDVHLPPYSRGAETPGTTIDGVPSDLSRPSLSTVLREAGLRLEPQKQLLDVYVVDHIEKPSPN